MLVPISLAGGTYRHKSLPLSAQTTRNLWPQPQEPGNEKSQYILQSWCGMRPFGAASSGTCRGMTVVRDVLYRVCGDRFYRVDATGAHESLGTVPFPGRAIFDSVAGAVVFAVSGRAFVWDGATLAPVSDSDLESPNAVTALNNQIIFDGSDQRFWVSDAGNAGNINSLNYASAESFTDTLVRPFAHNDFLYLLGSQSMEKWWNSGTGSPPVARVSAGGYGVGLGALHSIGSDENEFFFLGSDGKPYVYSGSALAPMAGQMLASEMAGYADFSDAIGWKMRMEGAAFSVLAFPSADKTYVLPEFIKKDGQSIKGEWFEWSSGADGGRSVANAYASCYGKHIVSDYRNGNLYWLDFDAYAEIGNPIIRVRDSAPLHGGLFGNPGKRMTMNRLELICQMGVGLISGQGSDPRVMLSFSDDGGRTFSPETFMMIGRMGAFQYKAEQFNLGTFESRIIRIKTSDPVAFSLHAAAADVEFGI